MPAQILEMGETTSKVFQPISTFGVSLRNMDGTSFDSEWALEYIESYNADSPPTDDQWQEDSRLRHDDGATRPANERVAIVDCVLGFSYRVKRVVDGTDDPPEVIGHIGYAPTMSVHSLELRNIEDAVLDE